MADEATGATAGDTGSGSGSGQVRIGTVQSSSFSIGGSNNTNTVHTGGTGADTPGAEELLEAVRELRAALVRLPRGADRTALDAELDEAAGELEEAGEIRPGLPARLRGTLERWAPLVESVNAAAALGGLLASLGG
ncbi:hypothetical protein ACFWUW_30420 [Streptomyces sp. NPDC058655]|uniref:hypothetical protein n=1 Tax=Streptomyces sp. NPDC058655 TaxID=3346577 RepID=UPI00364A977A